MLNEDACLPGWCSHATNASYSVESSLMTTGSFRQGARTARRTAISGSSPAKAMGCRTHTLRKSATETSTMQQQTLNLHTLLCTNNKYHCTLATHHSTHSTN